MGRNIMGQKVSRRASRLAEDKSFSVGDKVRVLEYHTDGDVGKEFQVGEVYTVDDIETWTTMPENKEVEWLYSEEADALLDPGKVEKVAMQPLYMPPQDGPTSIPQDFREVSPNRWVWEESPEGKTYEISLNRYEYFARVREEGAQGSTPVSSIGNSGGVFNSFDRAAQAIRSHAQGGRVSSRMEERESRPGGFLTQAQQWSGPKTAFSQQENHGV